MNKKYLIYTLPLLLIVILLTAILLTLYTDEPAQPLPTDANAVDWEGRQILQQAFNSGGGIAIPGFNSLTFAADQTTQKVNFYNPEINDCLFKMSLIVNDSTLWKSGNISPGKGYYSIELSDPLQSGEYSACLKVDCFTINGEPLNGAVVEFQLTVQ